MRAIAINSTERTVTEVDITGDLESLQAAVGGYIEIAAYLSEDDREVLFVNEEGLLHDPQRFFTYRGAHQPFAGNGIILGSDDEGETVGTSLDVEVVRAQVTFLSREEAYREVPDLGRRGFIIAL